MIKRTVNYKDFDGKERTEDLYFNLTQFEATEMSMEMPTEITEEASNIKTANDATEAGERLVKKMGEKGIVEVVKALVLKAYGVKSEDGRTFKKSAAISEEFSQTVAFSNFMMELLSNEEECNAFINGVIPSELATKMPTGISTTKKTKQSLK